MDNASGGTITWNLNIDSKHFEAGLAKASVEAKAMGSNLESSSSKGSSGLMSLAGVAKVATVAVAAVGVAMGVAGYQALKWASDAEMLRTNLDVLTGSAKVGGQLYKDLFQIAAKTPFETQDLVKSSAMMLSYGVSLQNVLPYLKMLGDVSLGDKNKLDGLTYAFSQVSATGYLMGQDLRQMINYGFNPLQVISEKTGRSMADLKDDMAEGKISFQMVADAMKTVTSEGGRFYQGMDKGSRTLKGLLSTVTDNVKMTAMAFVGLSEKGDIVQGGLFDKVKQGVEKTIPLLEDLQKKAGPMTASAFEWLGKAGTELKKILERIWNIVKPHLLPALERLGEATKEYMKVAKDWYDKNKSWLLPTLRTLAVVIGVIIVGAIVLLVESFTLIIKAMTKLNQMTGTILEFFKDAWEKVKNYFTGWVSWFATFPQKFIQYGKDIIQGFINGIYAAKNWITQAISNVMGAIGNFMAGAWNWLVEHGKGLIQGFTNGINGMWWTIWHGVQGVMGAIGNFMSGVGGWLWDSGRALIDGFVAGMWSLSWKPLSALGSILGNLWRLLPHSPAKEGPFSGAGWTLYSGKALVEGLTQGIELQASIAKDALGNTLQGMQSNISPNLATSTVNTSSNSNTAINFTGPINLGDKSAVDEFFGRLSRNQELAQKGMSTI